MRQNVRLVLTLAIVSLAIPTDTRAALIINFNQVGGDVVVTGAVSLVTSGLPSPGNTSSLASVTSSSGEILLGPTGINSTLGYNVTFAGPANFGTGAGMLATSGSGNAFGLVPGASLLIVPAAYLSGSALSASDVFAGQTFATLGLNTGTYIYTYSTPGIAAALDTITIRVNSAAVPEPASIALVTLGLAGVGFVARRRA